MKNKGKTITIILTFIILILSSTIVSAENSFNLKLSSTKKTLNFSESVEVTLSLSDINAGEEGVNVVEGFLTYNTEVFETLRLTDIKGLNDWDIKYNDSTGKILATKLVTGITEGEDVAKINFKVKENVTSQNTEITLKSVTSNNSEVLLSIGDKNVKLGIKENPGETFLPVTGFSKTLAIIVAIIAIAFAIYGIYKNVKASKNKMGK